MSEMANHNDTRNTPRRSDGTSAVAREKSDVSVRGLVKFGVALVALGIAANLLVWGMFTYFNTSAQKSQAPPPPMFNGNQLPPEPRLQGAPGHQTSALEDLLEMRQREDKTLGSFGWVDQQNGVVRIPIEDAKRLIVKRGTEGRFEEAPPTPIKPGKPSK